MRTALKGEVDCYQGGSPEEFMRLQKAYNILSNEDFKAAYDERLPKPGLASRPKVTPTNSMITET